MKKHLLLIIAAFSFLGTFAQTISVKSFQALPTDMTAGSLEGKRIDQNNEVCALIKIVTTQTGFIFEAGALGIVDTQQEAGEVWVWVPRGSRKITIKHPQLGVLREYRYPVEIEAERTYEMVLVTGTVETIVKEEVQEQYLMFEVVPAEAILEVNDQMWSISAEGTARKMVAFGTYTYRAQAPNYHPEAGNVIVNDPDNTKKVKIVLKPNFGWVEVPGTGVLQDAVVYIDNALIGKAPCKSDALKSGTHNIKIQKNLYVSYNATVTVNDNETTTVSPNLTADFARVTLQVDTDAEIWVNDEKKGVRTWTGELESGTYKIECKLANHEPSTVRKEITNQMNGEVIRLDAPRPIYGSLNVESTPDMATLYIDGKEIGETPKLIKEILIGQHEIRLTKQNYNDYATTVTSKKGERALVEARMDDVNYRQISKQGDEFFENYQYEEAMRCYRQAAEHGDPGGQTGMGQMYCYGEIVEKDYTEAMKWFQMAAAQGYADAENWIGALYYRGNGVSKDYEEAVKWFRKAAAQDLAKAQDWLGLVYRYGNGVKQDYGEAMRWYRKAANQDYALSWRAIGSMFKEGEGVTQDYAEATRCMIKAGELGDTFAYYTLAGWYKDGWSFIKDEAEANKYYRKAAEIYRAKAEKSGYDAYMMGELYKKGLGVSQDYAEAMKWYTQAMNLGYDRARWEVGYGYLLGLGVNKDVKKGEQLLKKKGNEDYANACYYLALSYKYGWGIPKDDKEAFKCYKMAADLGHAEAQYNVGNYYDHGKIVPENDVEAEKWYLKSAEGGYSSSWFALGLLYHNGADGVKKDYAKAMQWYRKGAEQGSSISQYKVGIMYENGEGVTKNITEAKKWYKDAIDALNRLK